MRKEGKECKTLGKRLVIKMHQKPKEEELGSPAFAFELRGGSATAALLLLRRLADSW